ncbi:MAG: exosome complex RNA-binding protein Rrp4 [archaeon]
MSELKVKDKEIVVPGEILAVGMDFLPSHGTYRKDDKIMANRLGLMRIEGKVLKSIPLAGRYLPKRNDVIIGKVTDITLNGWIIHFGSPYRAMVCLKDASFEYIAKGADLTKFFALDDYVSAKITQVSSQYVTDLTMKGPGLRKLKGGRIIHVNTHKVPRVIGKKGSMVSMIKKATDCRVIVGQNGIIWIQGEPKKEIIAVNTIKMIEKKAHVSGLTDKVKAYLEKETGQKIENIMVVENDIQ